MIWVTKYCVGCAFCMIVCPETAIEVKGNAEVDLEKCSECQMCVLYCPVEAIKLVKS